MLCGIDQFEMVWVHASLVEAHVMQVMVTVVMPDVVILTGNNDVPYSSVWSVAIASGTGPDPAWAKIGPAFWDRSVWVDLCAETIHLLRYGR